MHEGIPEVAVGTKIECPDCGETLVRKTEGLREVASGDEHECWSQLPKNAEHIRLD